MGAIGVASDVGGATLARGVASLLGTVTASIGTMEGGDTVASTIFPPLATPADDEAPSVATMSAFFPSFGGSFVLLSASSSLPTKAALNMYPSRCMHWARRAPVFLECAPVCVLLTLVATNKQIEEKSVQAWCILYAERSCLDSIFCIKPSL